MLALLHSLAMFFVDFFMPRRRLEVENLFLRHQLSMLWFEVTRHPTAEWLARQITEAFPWASAPAYLVRDNDRAYGHVFTSGASATDRSRLDRRGKIRM